MIKVVPLRYLHYCFDTNTANDWSPKRLGRIKKARTNDPGRQLLILMPSRGLLNFWCDRQQSLGFNSFR